MRSVGIRLAVVACALLCVGAGGEAWPEDLPWLEVASPRPTERIAGATPLVEVRGTAGIGRRAPVDVVVVLDLSESTLYPSGIDVDRDGLVGRLHERGVRTASGALRPAWLWTTDADDTILSAELEGARRLLKRLEAARTRVGLVRFAGRARELCPVGPVEDAMRALAKVRPSVDPSGTNLGSAIRGAMRLLRRSARRAGAGRRQVVIVLSDGRPTSPAPAVHARSYALRAAAKARDAGVHIYGYALGSKRGEARVLEEMAAATGGQFMYVRHMGEVVEHLPYTDFAGIEGVSMRNHTSGTPGRAIRLFGDGTFDGFVALEPGSNLLEIRIRSEKGVEMRTLRTVHYDPSGDAPDRGLSRLLEVRTIETELAARARAVRAARKREVKVEILR